MKRKFLKFPSHPVSYLPKMQNRRMRLGITNCNVAYKSEGGDPDKDVPKEFIDAEGDSDETKAIKMMGRQVHAFKKALGDKADATQFAELSTKIDNLAKGLKTMETDAISQSIKDINEANAKIWKQLAEVQEQLLQEKEMTSGSKKKVAFVETKAVENFIKETFEGAEEKNGKFRAGKKTKKEASIEIHTTKAAENFGYATFFEGTPDTDQSAYTGRVIDPTLYQRRRKTNIILDYFDIRTINVPELVYLVKVEDGDDAGSSSGDAGGAEWILSGEAKPKRSFRVGSASVKAKKVAIFGTVEDELLQDVASLERWIREDFMDEMREEINDGLLNNNPAVNPDAPLGLKTNATQFAASPAYVNKFTASSTTYIDQLIATFATMRYRKEEAGIAFVSSDVWYLIQHLKDSELRYQNNNLVYTNTLGQLYIAGVLIIPVDQDDIPSTHVLVVGKDLGFKIFAYGPMVFERGLNDDDFQHDRTSFRGYQRFLTYIPEQRENSVMYDTWANIQAGIEA